MSLYYSVLKLRLLNGMQYRAAALAGVATQFFWGFMFIMIFQAFFENSTVNPPISLKELIIYLWLQQAFLTFIMLWFRDNEIFNLITTGNIAYELCRPCEIYGFWYVKLLAQRLSSALLRCFPILIVAFFLPEPYRMTLPSSMTTGILFLLTLILGLFLVVAISMFIYISVFITMSPVGSTLVIGVIGEFFAGLIIPIPLMPEWLKSIAYVLPFRYTADFPFRVYSGHIPQNEALIGLLIQLTWLFVLIWLGKLALNKALRRVVVQGG
ncbi:ABC transporter permease [Peribacillus alkalitolerans]|uniref:ABC transporter permease n=1 Tax=Peribacillus alkalitolerans TaxID=1550385 RepID=UPI0013D79625|nr:ABC transporter permease [Peribacillus alkalitolerans]